jgi:SAM-dependent methyltransferase
MFRYPVLSAASYRELYEAGAADQWSGDTDRVDMQVVRSVIHEHPGVASVLDVGCGTADFLASLPASLSRCGIEPSAGAATEAARRGVRIVAGSIEELPADARFDVITLIDVIEHLPQPALHLERAYAHLASGGLLIVSTGDPLHPLWRKVFRSRFWYSSFPEHVAFPSRRFFDAWAARRGAHVRVLPIRYRQLPIWKSAVFLLIQAVYFASPRALDWTGRALGLLKRMPRPRRQYFAPGVGGLFEDHQVVAIRRPS